MVELVRSKVALTAAVTAAGVSALGYVLLGLAFAVYHRSDLSASKALEIAAGWLLFAAATCVVAFIGYVAWESFLARRWKSLAELAGVALATLILDIGFLISAIEGTYTSEAANVLVAVGIAGWGAAVLVGAARRALVEQYEQNAASQAGLRALGALALLAIAVGAALPDASISQKALAITTDAFWLFGLALLAVVIGYAKIQEIFSADSAKFASLGVAVIGLAYIAEIVSTAIVYGPGPYNIAAYRIGMSVPSFLTGVAYLIIAWAAFARLSELNQPSELPGETETPVVQPEAQTPASPA